MKKDKKEMKKNMNTITRCKFFFDLDKEFAYINEMNKNGWRLLYNKWGMVMTFEKTEPGEYVTIMHAEDKENIAKVSAFAAQCGYETIPHTMDGFGEILYLTGKKSEVSNEFISDKQSKTKLYKRVNKKYLVFLIIYLLLDLFFIAQTAAFIKFSVDKYNAAVFGYNVGPIVISIVWGIFAIGFLWLTFILARVIFRNKRRINTIKADSVIFE